ALWFGMIKVYYLVNLASNRNLKNRYLQLKSYTTLKYLYNQIYIKTVNYRSQSLKLSKTTVGTALYYLSLTQMQNDKIENRSFVFSKAKKIWNQQFYCI